MYQVFELFLAMGTAWSISGILYFSLPKNRKSPEAPYAIAVILVFLISILDNLLRPQLIPMQILNCIYPFSRLSYFLVGPVLLFYVKVLLKKDFKIKYRSFLHMLPFLIWFVYVLNEPASLHPRIIFAEDIARPSDPGVSPLLDFSFLWDLSVNLSRLIYSAVILMILRRNSEELPDRVSYINNKNTLSWLKYLLIFYTGIYLLNSLSHLFLSEEVLFFQIAAAAGRSLPAVLFVFLFSLFSEDQPVIASDESVSENNKYKKSGTSEGESKRLYSDLCSYLEKSKAYLDPELSLNNLAEEMGESRQRLSEVINRESSTRFFTFINVFRLQEFRDAVKSNRYPDFTILAVAMECGFRSSSGFYSLVKKELNTTPKALVHEILSKELE